MKERHDEYEQLNATDREDVDDFLGRFGDSAPQSRPSLHEQCSVLAEAVAKMCSPALSYFCSAIGVSENSKVFEKARIAGDRAYEWELAELDQDWLITYLLTDVDGVQFEEMMKSAAAARHGTFGANMHALLVLKENWRPNAPKYLGG